MELDQKPEAPACRCVDQEVGPPIEAWSYACSGYACYRSLHNEVCGAASLHSAIPNGFGNGAM